MIVSDGVIQKKRKRNITKYVYRFKLNNSNKTETSKMNNIDHKMNKKFKNIDDISQINRRYENELMNKKDNLKRAKCEDFGGINFFNPNSRFDNCEWQNTSFENLRLPPFQNNKKMNNNNIKLPSIHQILEQCGIR